MQLQNLQYYEIDQENIMPKIHCPPKSLFGKMGVSKQSFYSRSENLHNLLFS